MKRRFLVPVLVIMLLASCGPALQTTGEEEGSAITGYETFYTGLSPYGRWVEYPGYGQVWIPNAGYGFRPYATNGHWVYSGMGWAWASDYNWGWAPFHYGRWFYNDPYGWMWMPGHEWAPAWVTWGYCNGYYGWAPLSPHVGLGVSVGNPRNPPANYWNFVPSQHVNKVNVNNYMVNNNSEVINNLAQNVTIINNNPGNTNRGTSDAKLLYNRGPAVRDVEKQTGQRIQPVQIQAMQKQAAIADRKRLPLDRPAIKEEPRPVPVQQNSDKGKNKDKQRQPRYVSPQDGKHYEKIPAMPSEPRSGGQQEKETRKNKRKNR